MRAKSVGLTKTGEVLVRELIPKVAGVDALFFKKLSKEDQQTLISVLGWLAKIEQ